MDERFAIYCDILYRGLINIRMAAQRGDLKQCEEEADHLHNIPHMLKEYDNEGLHDYYWNCMRHDDTSEYANDFKYLWSKLEEIRKNKK